MAEFEDLLCEARQTVQQFSGSLPTIADPASVSLTAKIPYKVLCYREGLIWRVEELARSACDCYERGDAVAGIVLTRTATETSAAVWYLHDLMRRQVENGVQPDLDVKVTRLLLGHKNASEMPTAINVLTFLDLVEKTVPGVRKLYDTMSEYAHPNWSGTAFAYSQNDTQNYMTYFGRGTFAGSDKHAGLGLRCLLGALTMFELSYNRIAELMPSFIQACEADLFKPQS
jgi:hypothetical protein